MKPVIQLKQIFSKINYSRSLILKLGTVQCYILHYKEKSLNILLLFVQFIFFLIYDLINIYFNSFQSQIFQLSIVINILEPLFKYKKKKYLLVG